jgi:hypothetical protein
MNVDSQRSRTRAWFAVMGLMGVLTGMVASAFAQAGGTATGSPPPTGSASSQASVGPPPAPLSSAAPPVMAPPSPSNPSPPQAAPNLQQSESSASTLRPTAAGLSGASAHVILSVDRLFGAWAWSQTSSVDVGAAHTGIESSGTGFNLLWSNPGSNPYATPRLSVDAVIGPGITLGGSIGYATSGGSSESTTTVSNPGSTGTPRVTDQDLPKFAAFVLTPRVGGLIMLGEHASLWLRGGITYYHSTTESTIQDTSTVPATSFTRNSTFNLTAVTFDPEIVFLPTAHFGLTLGAVADIGLGGSFDIEESEAPTGIPPTLNWHERVSDYGVSAGVLGFF